MEQPGPSVLAREGELAGIDAWLAAIPRSAPLSLLVIAGEPGIGKTTLWAEATRRAGGPWSASRS